MGCLHPDSGSGTLQLLGPQTGSHREASGPALVVGKVFHLSRGWRTRRSCREAQTTEGLVQGAARAGCRAQEGRRRVRWLNWGVTGCGDRRGQWACWTSSCVVKGGSLYFIPESIGSQ